LFNYRAFSDKKFDIVSGIYFVERDAVLQPVVLLQPLQPEQLPFLAARLRIKNPSAKRILSATIISCHIVSYPY
jgi:hypothetical protein